MKDIIGFSSHTLQHFRINVPQQNFVLFSLNFLALLTVAGEKAFFLDKVTKE